MNTSPPSESSPNRPHASGLETSNTTNRPLSPTSSPKSPSFPTPADSETTYPNPEDQREDGSGTKSEAASSSKVKKKLSELDIRAAMPDIDLRKSGKRNGIEDFYIQLDEPHRIWCPGDVVKGHVHLILDKPVKTQFVMLKITGMLSASIERDKVEYAIFEHELKLWGTRIHNTTFDRTFPVENGVAYDTPKKNKDEWEIGVMEEGEHPFPFELELPAKSLPSSVDFGKGSINYTICCIHQRPPSFLGMRNKSVAQKDIPILDLIDVAIAPVPKPFSWKQPDHSKKGKATGEIQADVELQKAGYLRGEQIRLNIKIRHTKPIKNLQGAMITFYRLTRFDNPRGEPSTFRKDLAQTIQPIICDPRTLDCNVSPRIRIPTDTFPTIHNTQYLSFRYYLEVILDLNPKISVFQTSSTPQDYAPDEVKLGPMTFIDTMALLKKSKPFVQSCQFEIVVGTLDSAAKNFELQLQRQQHLWRQYHKSSNAKRLPLGIFPPAPSITRRRDSTRSVASSTSSFARNPPPPFPRGPSSPIGISLAGGPRSRSHSTNSRSSISKSTLIQREEALLPSEPPERIDTDYDASAPPMNEDSSQPIDAAAIPDTPQIHISKSSESLTALRIEVPQLDPEPTINEDEQFLASLQSRVSAPTLTVRTPTTNSVRRRPVSRDIDSEASAPPLDDSTEDNYTTTFTT